MAPTPGEEGLGRRAGSFDLFGAFIPRDPRGIVLACGFLGAAGLGVNALFLGDWIGFAYFAGAGVGYFFLQTRLVPASIWLAIAGGGVAGASAGDASDWVVAGLGAFLALLSLLPPAVESEPGSSRKPEVRRAGQPIGPNLDIAATAPTSGKPELRQDASHPSNGSAAPAIDSVRAPSLTVQLTGTLHIEVDGQDQLQRIREQPRLHFLLSYLLARATLGEPSIDRSALADEMAPNLPAVNQRDRLRRSLHALQSALGSQLKPMLKVGAASIALDLGAATVDVFELRELDSVIARRQGLTDPETIERVRGALESTAGELLAGFAELEKQVTGGRGSAGTTVQAARVQVAAWRANLTLALARHYEASGRPQSSIAYLQAALAASPDREDLARQLVAAYLQTGQTARANEVRADYELSSGEAR